MGAGGEWAVIRPLTRPSSGKRPSWRLSGHLPATGESRMPTMHVELELWTDWIMSITAPARLQPVAFTQRQLAADIAEGNAIAAWELAR